jgi:hypothetical protein
MSISLSFNVNSLSFSYVYFYFYVYSMFILIFIFIFIFYFMFMFMFMFLFMFMFILNTVFFCLGCCPLCGMSISLSSNVNLSDNCVFFSVIVIFKSLCLLALPFSWRRLRYYSIKRIVCPILGMFISLSSNVNSLTIILFILNRYQLFPLTLPHINKGCLKMSDIACFTLLF